MPPNPGTPAEWPAEAASGGVRGSGTEEKTEAGGEGPIPKDYVEIPIRNLAGHGEGFKGSVFAAMKPHDDKMYNCLGYSTRKLESPSDEILPMPLSREALESTRQGNSSKPKGRGQSADIVL